MEYLTINEIKREYYSKTNGHWFDKGTMRYFNCRLPRYGIKTDTGTYFISSEQYVDFKGNVEPRLYTIRKMELSGQIETIGKFQQYKTRQQAQRTLDKIIK